MGHPKISRTPDEKRAIRAAQQRAWFANNREKVTALRREWQRNNKDKQKNNYIKYFYGITLDQLNSMKALQKNRCAICQKEKKLHIDHCHKTKAVRGLLCHGCNIGIGGFCEDTQSMVNAIAYINYTTAGDTVFTAINGVVTRPKPNSRTKVSRGLSEGK